MSNYPAHRLIIDEKTVAKIVKLYRDEHLPLSRIRERMGIHPITLRRILVEAGVEIAPKRC